MAKYPIGIQDFADLITEGTYIIYTEKAHICLSTRYESYLAVPLSI